MGKIQDLAARFSLDQPATKDLKLISPWFRRTPPCGTKRRRVFLALFFSLTVSFSFLILLKLLINKVLIDELNLEDVDPVEIDDHAPLIGEGLGLDSLDAVELVLIVEKHFGGEIKDQDEGKVAFRSIINYLIIVLTRWGCIFFRL